MLKNWDFQFKRSFDKIVYDAIKLEVVYDTLNSIQNRAY